MKDIFIQNKKYSEASGVQSMIDENIEMYLNKYGIYEEYFGDSSPIEKVIEVSPNFNSKMNETIISDKLFSNYPNINHSKYLGYYLNLYVGHVTEENYRANGSSGGFGTWILKELLERNLIDGVIHVTKNESDSALLFNYSISRTIEEVKAGSGTKYYPVELSKVLKLVKDNPGRYALVGIPSFIYAVRLLSDIEPIFKERIKYTIGLICGHQKSTKFAESMAWQVGIKPGDLLDINFRKKIDGKPSNQYAVEFTGLIDNNLVKIIKPTDQLVGQNWGQGFFKVYASDFTDDVMNETSDVTIGDAWLKEYLNDSLGNNVLIVRNPEIQAIIRENIELGNLKFNEVTEEVIYKSQEGHYRHTRDELSYRLFKKDSKNEWRPIKRVNSSNQLPMIRRKIQDLREEISVKSHIYYNEALEKGDFEYFLRKMNSLSKKYKVLYFINNLKNAGFKKVLSYPFKFLIRKLKR